MSAKELAAAAKKKGNDEFQAKNYEEAIKHFTEAIKHDPTDHVFFSNRSACFASLEKYEKAYEDAKECVKLKPDWPKGYTRKGLAEFFLKKYNDAADTYKAGLKLAPEDPTLKEGYKKALDAQYDVPGAGAGGGGAGGGGRGPGLNFDLGALNAAAAKNPKIKEYMQDKQVMQKVQMIMQMGGNEQMQQQMLMQVMQQDPRVLEVVMAMQGIDIDAMKGGEDGGMGGPSGPSGPSSAPPPKETKKEEPPPDNRTDSQKKADEFKTKGNELYKKKQFTEALEQYDKAIETEPNDLIYYNNKCAVWIEMGEEYYDKVLECCQDLINRRYEINSATPGGASFEKVAKVFNRMASVHEKRKQYDQAIELYNKALCEDNNRQTRNALRDLERAKEKHEKEAYIDVDKAEAHREKGNELFKEQKWADAKAEYDEGVKRNPKDAKIYSNRAACLTKLCAYPDALRDLDECLKLDPKFIKAYSRKGAAHFFMKEYNKALKAYDEGLKIDPNDEACKQGRDSVIQKIQSSQQGEVDEEQIRHAMADPEIQQILHDPQIKMFLQRMQDNPREAQKEMAADPKLQEAVSKLMAAGIIRTG